MRMHRVARAIAPCRSLSITRPHRPSDSFLTSTSAHWQSLVTRDVGAALLRDGFAVLHRAFPPDFTRSVRSELQFLHATDQLYANSTHILLHGEQTPTLLEKQHIVETELVLPEIRAQLPTLEWFFDSRQVFDAIQGVVPDWLGLSSYMIKLQYNEGNGGCFPMHFDSYGDDGKCITVVLYLNDGWHDGDGGEIVLYPFPQRDPVIVRPLDGDIVLFSSQHMLHRVMPATKPRYCLTTWIYSAPNQQTATGRAQHYTNNQSEPSSYALDVMDKIMRSSFRRHLIKLLYRDAWATSLHESHRQTPSFEKYMATHEREVDVIANATAQMLAKFRAKDPRQPSTLPATADELFAYLKEDQACRTRLETLPIVWF